MMQNYMLEHTDRVILSSVTKLKQLNCIFLQRDRVDAVSLDASHAFIAGKCGLVPVVTEYYGKTNKKNKHVTFVSEFYSFSCIVFFCSQGTNCEFPEPRESYFKTEGKYNVLNIK